MDKKIEFSVNKKNNRERLDVFLSKEITYLTRSYIKKLIEKNKVKLNKVINTSPSTKIKVNDKIIINIIEEENLKLVPNKIKLNIIYEDKDLLIINKPKGMVVHPGAGNYKNTLVNALLYKYKKSLGHISGKLTFETYLDECKKIGSNQQIQKKNYDFWAMIGGKYHSLLLEWHNVFGDRLQVCFFDDMVKDEPQFVAEICKWLELDKSQIDDNKTKVQNKSMIYRSKGLQRFATSFDNRLSGVWHYLPWLKWPLSGIYNLVNAKPNTEKISDLLRNELVNYYSSDISNTRNFLEEMHIKNIPEWMVR